MVARGRTARTQIMQCPGDGKISTVVVGPVGMSRGPVERVQRERKEAHKYFVRKFHIFISFVLFVSFVPGLPKCFGESFRKMLIKP